MCLVLSAVAVGSGSRPIVDRDAGTPSQPPSDSEQRLQLDARPVIDVPVAVAVQTGERGLPRSYGARTYRDIRSWHDLDRGGHFTAWQVPDTLADEVAAFAATLGQ